jgi:hypothetical protein
MAAPVAISVEERGPDSDQLEFGLELKPERSSAG